jgi:hypothetical protein
LKLWFGLPSSTMSPTRLVVSLRIEAAAKMMMPSLGSTNGMEQKHRKLPQLDALITFTEKDLRSLQIDWQSAADQS